MTTSQPARPPADQAYVFEARRPVVAVVEEYLEAMAAYTAEVDKLAKRIRPRRAPGATKARIQFVKTDGRGTRLWGFEAQGTEGYDKKAELPEGWRVEKAGWLHVLVPNASTPKGKKLAKSIADLSALCPIPIAAQLPGMATVIDRQDTKSAGTALVIHQDTADLWWDEHHTRLWAAWHPAHAGKVPVDSKVWKPVWGSRFLRLQETGSITQVDV